MFRCVVSFLHVYVTINLNTQINNKFPVENNTHPQSDISNTECNVFSKTIFYSRSEVSE